MWYQGAFWSSTTPIVPSVWSQRSIALLAPSAVAPPAAPVTAPLLPPPISCAMAGAVRAIKPATMPAPTTERSNEAKWFMCVLRPAGRCKKLVQKAES